MSEKIPQVHNEEPAIPAPEPIENIPAPENPFSILSQERILKVRAIIQHIPLLAKLYKGYTDAEMSRGNTVQRRDALFHVYTTLRRGHPDDIRMADMLLATPARIDITPEHASDIKLIINKIPSLKELHDQVRNEIIEARRKLGTLTTAYGYPSITNIDVIRAMITKLKAQPDTDLSAQAFLHILIFYAA
jgi:hypothetical protein